jgi:predicted NBD/HSP70 family sugar kinase
MELGHIIIKRDGRKCVCGHRGCLEAEIGSEGIIANFYEKLSGIGMHLPPNKLTLQDIYSCCLKNDKMSLLLLNEVADSLALGLSPVIQLLNPEKIIIHGPVCVIGKSFVESLKHKLAFYCFPEIVEKTLISCSASDEFLAAAGASLAIREKLLFDQL